MKSELLDVGLFQKYLEDKGLGASTIRQYVFIINNFLVTNPDIDDIDGYNIFLVEHSIKKRNYKVLYAFRAFIKFKIEDIYLRKKLINNLVKVTQAEPNITTKYLSNSKREDVIRNMTDDRYVLVAKIQNETGARARDILSLKKGSISFEKYQGLLALKLDIIGKGKKKNPKYIFDKELQQDILNFIKDKDIDKEYYFIDRSKCYDKNFDNMEIVFLTNYNWYWQELKKACIKSGIDPKQWGSHDYRRCIAREVYIATDKDVEQLKNFLGHARIETTLRYLKHSGLSTIDTSLLLARKNNRV